MIRVPEDLERVATRRRRVSPRLPPARVDCWHGFLVTADVTNGIRRANHGAKESPTRRRRRGTSVAKSASDSAAPEYDDAWTASHPAGRK